MRTSQKKYDGKPASAATKVVTLRLTFTARLAVTALAYVYLTQTKFREAVCAARARVCCLSSFALEHHILECTWAWGGAR